MSSAPQTFSEPRVKRWTKQEYNENVERGFFEGKRLFLFRGELIEMPPQNNPHAFAIMMLTDWLTGELRTEGITRIQLPFETPGESMPEPDAALVLRTEAARKPHPCKALLVIEVAESSIHLDRKKAMEYAAADVPEYWIVDCVARRVEIYRDIIDDSTSVLGKRYATTKVVNILDSISPLVKPVVVLPIASLFQ